MSNFKEIEFKYDSTSIGRGDFDAFLVNYRHLFKRELLLLAFPPNGKSSVDHYYSDGVRFMRWREGQDNNNSKTWELTSKTKLNETNNVVREEVNITLHSKGMSLSKAKAFSEQHGLKYDFSIRKDVQIYWLEKVVFSHYTVFDFNGKELDIFMEIEANEAYPWKSEEEALEVIGEWEKTLAPLGITPRHRIKKSLFEFYTGKINITENEVINKENENASKR
jgi:adenylate cyclase class IV